MMSVAGMWISAAKTRRELVGPARNEGETFGSLE